MKSFPSIDSRVPISKTEEEILKFWKKEKIFEKSISHRNKRRKFEFLDGPPFATGTPHYGHILAGTLKDAIPRYKTMQGYRVERKWGWDCHGVPVEFQVEKEHQIGGKPGIEKLGIDKFNELCRSIVMRCADQWENTVERMGRFVDFKNDYKTMNPEFMESVWWVFSELWKKGLIYEGEKVVAYSPKLGSPLSNFEANQNYKDIDDPAITVKFELTSPEPGRTNPSKEKIYLLAWTTTPWTLPSNLALAVHPEIQYVKIKHQDSFYIVSENLVEKVFGEGTKIEKRIDGKSLVGKKYKPLFPFFKNHKNSFQIFGDKFVSDEEGTGIVHMAPNFGEEDSRICAKNNLQPIKNPIDENGYFDTQISKLKGKYFRFDPEVKESKTNNANDWVLEELKKEKLLFHRSQIRHSYPHCWRSDCALMYRGIETWFVNIQKIKKEMISQNKNINWIPPHLKNGRFGKGLESAPDWAISRNRYWGTPLPVWKCSKTGEIQVIGSIEELEKLSGKKVPDLHRHFIDDLTWKNEKTGGTMKRISEVLDCWFESGAMPYASKHYPFEKNKDFISADFIAEGLDQTRGWFYTLHVLGVALFGKNVFKNVITNGIVLSEDGTKMSKSKKNYPDPKLIFDKYGADAMRFYLLNSPVARGENLRFCEHGVDEVLKSVILPLRSTYQFFSTYANIDGWTPTKFIFQRHGHSDSNKIKIYSGKVDNPHHLTEKGKSQIEEIVKILPDFDVFYASPLVRTKETAEIIKKIKKIEPVIDKRLQEISFGELEGASYTNPEERMKNKTTERPTKVIERLQSFFNEMAITHKGKTILAVSHGGPIRHLEGSLFDLSDFEDLVTIPNPPTGTYKVFFPNPNPTNELDKWILSELQTTVKEFRKNFDAYKLDDALGLVPKFIDKLNNWYLRRSRRRFWASGLDEDKVSGYETLHYTLLTISKLIAPICPFLAEKLYQDLGGGTSVHLETFPFPIEKSIDKKIEKQIALSREIVSLAAGIRANKKIKLRQPLQKLQFITTKKIDLDLDIIQEEANVKEVEVLKSVEGVAQHIIRVNAKKVGPRLGGKVQELIKEGKLGNFKELKNGQIEIAKEILNKDEYETGFLCSEGVEAESTSQVVVLIDTEITSDLETEGMSREIIRAIQELRKTKNFNVSDRISLRYRTNSKIIESAFRKFEKNISGEVLAEEIIHGGEILKEMESEMMNLAGENAILEISKSL